MSDTAPSPNPEPAAEPGPPPGLLVWSLAPLPWWLPGLVLGGLAGLVVGAAGAIDVLRDPAPRGAYRATARVLVRPAGGEPAVPAAERQRVAFLFRDRALLARALAAPEGAAEQDPVPELDRRLAVDVTEAGVATVALIGDHPGDLTAVLDRIVARFAEEYAALDRKRRDERLSRVEKIAGALRSEIELQEKAIEMVAHANGTGDPSALLRDRLNRVETELAKGEPEFAILERRVEALKKRQPTSSAADAGEAAQLTDADPRVAPLLAQRADAVVALEKERAVAPGAVTVKDLQAKLDRAEKALAGARDPVRKEIEARLRDADARRAGRELEEAELRLAGTKSARESLRQERDAARKLVASADTTGASTEGRRRALVPLQEQADKVAAQLAQLRADEPTAEPRTQAAGPAVVERNRGPWRWAAPIGSAGLAFACGFVLATAFQLTGLVFRALQPPGRTAAENAALPNLGDEQA